MAIRVRTVNPLASTSMPLRAVALPLALLVVIALSLPMLTSQPANMTSDESLYLAEAYGIAHGHGVTYPSGEAVTHRPPLYPLLLAPAVKLGGPSAAYRVTRLVVLGNAVLLMLLVWRMAGSLAGAITGVAAAGSTYLNGLGATLYLDPLECTFMLVALGALHEASERKGMRWFAASGLLLGLAFLVKESAVQWAPVGVLVWLGVPSLRNRAGAWGALAFTLAFVGGVTPWWIWVWIQSRTLFMLGSPGAGSIRILVAGAASLAMFGAAIALWPRVGDSSRKGIAGLAPFGAGAVVLAWAAFMLAGLTRYAGWPYPNDYPHTIPRYLHTVAPSVQPYLLLAASWCGIAILAMRGQQQARVIACAALLFLPFALFSANRNLQLRDSLPLIYLSYAALGVWAAAVIAFVRARMAQPMGDVLIAAALVAFGGAFALQQAATFRTQNVAAVTGVRADSWENPFEQHIAGWLAANLPARSNILASRLYFSSLYVDTGGRFNIRQMPTVRVDIDPARPGLLASRSNLFRWGDFELRPTAPADSWLYLQQFPSKNYWVGLSQQELLDYIAAHDIDYVVLTGEDAAFSSLAYADYFAAHPAFKLRYHERNSASDQLFVFDVDRSLLAPRAHSTVISPRSQAALERQTGLDAVQLSTALRTPLHVMESDAGLSNQELDAAIAGVDLGRDMTH